MQSQIFRCETLVQFFSTLVVIADKVSSLMHQPTHYFNVPEKNRLEIQTICHMPLVLCHETNTQSRFYLFIYRIEPQSSVVIPFLQHSSNFMFHIGADWPFKTTREMADKQHLSSG